MVRRRKLTFRECGISGGDVFTQSLYWVELVILAHPHRIHSKLSHVRVLMDEQIQSTTILIRQIKRKYTVYSILQYSVSGFTNKRTANKGTLLP